MNSISQALQRADVAEEDVVQKAVDQENVAQESVTSVTQEEDASNELVQRIRKLRWMGMDEEADRLQERLHEIHQADILLSGPGDTD